MNVICLIIALLILTVITNSASDITQCSLNDANGSLAKESVSNNNANIIGSGVSSFEQKKALTTTGDAISFDKISYLEVPYKSSISLVAHFKELIYNNNNLISFKKGK